MVIAEGSLENYKGEEAINHPKHYGGDTTYEAIKVIKEWAGEEGFKGFCIGNALKYLSRSGKKYEDKEVEDIKKAIWYLEYFVKHNEKSRIH
jgi:hypothetical protein